MLCPWANFRLKFAILKYKIVYSGGFPLGWKWNWFPSKPAVVHDCTGLLNTIMANKPRQRGKVITHTHSCVLWWMHLTTDPLHIGSSSVRDLTLEHIFTTQLQILFVFFWADFYLHFGERCLVWLENLITFLTADSVEPSLLNWIIWLSIRQTFNTILPILLSISLCSFTCPLEMPQEKQLKDDISFK